MQSPGTGQPDNDDLRRYLRDLAAVTALPAVWASGDRRRIVDGMAEVTASILNLNYTYVRLEGSTAAEAIEAVHFAKPPTAPVSASEIGKAFAPHASGRLNETALLTLPD